MEAYSALKAAWHTRDIEALRAGRGIVPHHLYLILSDLCNQDCDFCTYRSPTGWASEGFGADMGKGFTMNPARFMDRRKALEIITDAAELGVKAIQFTGGGEPTVHPDHEGIMAAALDLGLQVGLVTNGTRIPKGIAHRLTWIRVSIDAGKEETYARSRKSNLWPKVMENLSELAALGPGGPTLGASFVVTDRNYLEIGMFYELMRFHGVPYVKISANLTIEGLDYYTPTMLAEIERQIRGISTGASPRIVNAFADRLNDLAGPPSQPYCGQQRFAGYIGADLKVYRCCNTAYTKHGEIGDLAAISYREWLLDGVEGGLGHASRAFNGFDGRTCRHCQFQNKNEAIAYLIQPAPEHVEFI